VQVQGHELSKRENVLELIARGGTMSVYAEQVQSRILSLLEKLPPESLAVVEQFVRFVYELAQKGQVVETVTKPQGAPYLYPTVPVPASSLRRWVNLLAEGYEGDALADTEALYDEV
jgi:aspartate/methionine/tyrosine aminotransferase